MSTVRRRRGILISGVCGLILLCTLYTQEFWYSFPTNSDHKQLRNDFVLQSDVNDTLLDLQDFYYIMNNGSVCRGSAIGNQSSIAIIVHTARSNFGQRYAVRETWGSVKLYKGWTFHLVFLLGNDPTGNDALDTRLWEEYRQHGDMVMGNFADSYRNLTYKHLMGYKWVMSFCSDAKLILKTDDDIFVDIFHLVEVTLIELIHSDKAYSCYNMGVTKPMRSLNSKWHVNEELYPGEVYPAYCSGSVYLMKAPAAAKIFSVCNRTKFFWVDDVYVTGILRENYNILTNVTERLDILSVNSQYNLSWGDKIKLWCNTGLNEQLPYTYVLLGHEEFVRSIFCMWNKVRLLKFAVNHV